MAPIGLVDGGVYADLLAAVSLLLAAASAPFRSAESAAKPGRSAFSASVEIARRRTFPGQRRHFAS